jgi:hypothetical protein
VHQTATGRLEEIIEYCSECDRYFDVRSGCEADIQEDESGLIRSLLERCLPFVGRKAPASLNEERAQLLTDLHLALGHHKVATKESSQEVRSGWVDPETTARYLKALETLKSFSLSCRLQELESEVAIIKSRLEKETT